MNWFKKDKKETLAPGSPQVSGEMIQQRLRPFLAGKSEILAGSEISPDTKLFSSGLLDSLAFIELVTFLESEFKVRLSDAGEVNLDSLDSIELITRKVLDAFHKKKS